MSTDSGGGGKMDPKRIRAILRQYGEKLGGELITVKKVPWDKKFDQRQKVGAINLNKKFFMYETVIVPITETKIEGPDANNATYVQFNGKTELRLPILDIKSINEVFPTPNATLIKECVEGKTNRWGSKWVFTDLERVVDEVNQLNVVNENIIKAFFNEIAGLLTLWEKNRSMEFMKRDDCINGMQMFNAMFSAFDASYLSGSAEGDMDVIVTE